jgi:hypothetical protein
MSEKVQSTDPSLSLTLVKCCNITHNSRFQRTGKPDHDDIDNEFCQVPFLTR